MRGGRNTWLTSVSALFLGFLGTGPAHAQETGQEEVIVVTGIRGSLQRSMDIKRNASGVVDAISAEEIGKFPDTNLAESLQRITGVSIDRVNGEGSLLTVRGFGPGFNLVTLNGRQMPTADLRIVGSSGDGDYGTFTSRSFDFSVLASEGVTGLEVYKSGDASVSTGGIGATVNVKTLRPLENPKFQATVAAKGVLDQSVEQGDDITPEVTGLFSWADPSETYGVSLFGAYQKRDFSSVGASNNNWNIERGSAFLDPANGRVRADNPATPNVDESTVVVNPPSANQLVSYPNNSDYFYTNGSRERLNAQLTAQFRPFDTLTLTGDAFYAQTESEESRHGFGNWFNRPFSDVIFDGDPVVATAVYLEESLSAPKDIAWGQVGRFTKETVQTFGFNAEWLLTDRLSVSLDLHTGEAKGEPNGPGGRSSYDFGTGAAAISQHSLDQRSGFPVQRFTYTDINGNNNGIIDIPDISSSVGRTATQFQSQDIDQFRFDASYAISDNMKVDAGVDYRTTSMTQKRVVTAQILGDWGVVNPGDIEANAPGVLETYCLKCLFDDYTPGDAEVAIRGDAAALYNALSPYYLGLDPSKHAIQTWNNDFNVVDEDITAVYLQFAWDGQVIGRDASLTAGARYEETEVTAASTLSVPDAVVWNADNDFSLRFPGNAQGVSQSASYDNFLPNVNFKIELIDDLIARASYSKTIARADYANLFVTDSAGTPNRASILGGIGNGSSGNTALIPLESSNIDLSLEAYYDEASYFSIGVFNKDVENFIGLGQTTKNLFGLRDPSTNDPNSRSGQALALVDQIGALRNDVNLFVMTALVDNPAVFPDPIATFQANSTNGVLNQTFADQIFADYDIVSDANDPLLQLQVTRPINQREANIHGVEIGIQHFFGDTGFGFQANYTLVDGDVGVNVASDPGVDQFALEGLSDTANATLIYEKYGVSARLAYNWRDEFLVAASRGDCCRNPIFADPFETWDINVSYDVTPNVVLSFEGINLMGENIRTFGRSKSNYHFIQELDPRYLVGARVRFN